MDNYTTHNPWKGLNYYVEGETLYGRNSEIESLSQYVVNNSQTVLYGMSGIGKSSILHAGVFPIARQQGMLPVGVRLDHLSDESYVQQIHHAIISSGVDIHPIVPAISPDGESLWEYMHRNVFFDAHGQRKQLLLVLDQFEEIFTLQQDEQKKRAFFDELADLLNDVMPLYVVNAGKKDANGQDGRPKALTGSAESRDISLEDLDISLEDLGINLQESASETADGYLQKTDFHLVFTLREDFLSYLERYSAFIPSMKMNRYALLPLNEEQAADIIMNPCKGLVSSDVAELIIQKVTGKTGFSLNGIPEIDVDAAVLSLYLSRLFIKKSPDAPAITAELVNQFSADIIKDFYEESVADLPQKDIEQIEDQLLTYDGRRNNVSRNDLVREGVSEEVITLLADERKLLRQFSYQDDIRVEFMHDILCPVVDERISRREAIHQQEEERQRQEAERRQLLEEQRAELLRIEEENARQHRRNRFKLSVVIALLVVAVLGWFAFLFVTTWEFTESYASFTTKDGWPVGIGKTLDKSDRNRMPVYYELVRYGYWNKNTRVNVKNNKKELSRNKFHASPLVRLYETEGRDEQAKSFANLQRQTAYWIFTADNEGRVSRQTAYSVDGTELYAVQFFHAVSLGADSGEATAAKRHNQLWATYIDKDGKSLRVRDNGADRMRIMVNDTTGYYVGYQFFSESGTPQPNDEGAYGYRLSVDRSGRITQRLPLDAFGDAMHDRPVVYTGFDDYGRWTATEGGGHAEYGPLSVLYTLNNRTDTLLFSERGSLTYHSESIGDSLLNTFRYQKGKVVSHSRYRRADGLFKLYYSEEPLPQRDSHVTEVRIYCADSVKSWQMIREERTNGHYLQSFFEGTDSVSITGKMVVPTGMGWYHQFKADTTVENGLTKVLMTWLDVNGHPSGTMEVNSEVDYYNANNELVKRIQYRDGTIRYAYLNEYENGQIVSQAVMGIDGTPVRYAGWDYNEFCYYKMKLVYNFSNMLVAIKGVNEFGEESLITNGEEVFQMSVVPSVVMSYSEEDSLATTQVFGLQQYTQSFSPLPFAAKVDYIRITDKQGSWYQAGLRDGDLLISEGRQTKVARPNAGLGSYDIMTFSVKEGPTGAEHYPVYFNEKETKRYKEALSQQ